MLREIEEIDLLRLVEGDCSPEEAVALQAWIGAHPRRTQLLAELRAVWRLTGSTTRSWVVADARLRLLRGWAAVPVNTPGTPGVVILTTKRAARFRHL